MANKITGLTELATTPAGGDVVPIVDVSDTTQATSGTTKHISMSNLLGGLPKVVSGYQGYVIIPGPSSTSRYQVQTGDVIMGKGAFAGGNAIIAVATANSPTLDTELDFYLNNNIHIGC